MHRSTCGSVTSRGPEIGQAIDAQHAYTYNYKYYHYNHSNEQCDGSYSVSGEWT